MVNLVIRGKLSSEPLSQGLYFRFLTMVSKQDLGLNVLLECDKNRVDLYYNQLKINGWFDFVNDIVVPEWRVEGIRVDTELNYPYTIRTQYIRSENVFDLLGQVENLRKLFGDNYTFDP